MTDTQPKMNIAIDEVAALEAPTTATEQPQITPMDPMQQISALVEALQKGFTGIQASLTRAEMQKQDQLATKADELMDFMDAALIKLDEIEKGIAKSTQEPNVADMGITEMANLMHIRDYVVNAISKIGKDKYKDFQHLQVLLEDRIANQLVSAKFKALVGFENAPAVMAAAAKANNIKNGMRPSNQAVAMNAGKAFTIKP